MSIHNKQRIRKLCVGVSLGLALMTSGVAILDGSSTAYAASSQTSSSVADSIIATGLKFQGTPYKFGAKSGNTSSFDCSSFTQYVFKQNGVTLPRTSTQQSTAGTYVPRSQLQPGDLVFFYSPIHHVAIYMGDGKILHTYGKGGVTVTNLNSGWWDSHYTTARRVLPSSGQSVSHATKDNNNDNNNKNNNDSNNNNNSNNASQDFLGYFNFEE
ncbi:C40 family peptidase [Paenibacillus sp. JW14]|uniref:C40 family peptidase n=1 Tax=Paenibacillus agri TaxID=2744309 RepID=A0A850EM52_9BACL|nr:C40 family peptidase [Paenibacillus agri]